MSKYENYEICEKCNGSCCRSGGCIISPDQIIGFNKEVLKKLIYSGIIMIDWWEGDPREEFYKNPTEYEKEILEETKDIKIGDIPVAYYLRIREMKDDPKEYEYGSWGGQCMLHNKYGKCPIDISKRPYEAAYMIPNKDRISPDTMVRFYATCNGDKNYYHKSDIAASFIKYNDIFEDFLEDMLDEEITEDTFKFREKDSINEYLSVIKETNFEEEK